MSNVTQTNDVEMVSLSFRASRAFWERLHTYAVKTRQTVRFVLIAAVTKYLDEQEERPEAAA